jgi:hypothetical protein
MSDYIDYDKLKAVMQLISSLETTAPDAILLLLAAIKTIDLNNRRPDSTKPLAEIVVEMLDSLQEERVQ